MTTRAKLPMVRDVRPSLGGDPEFFLRNAKGEVIGAEKVLPKDGLIIHAAKYGTLPAANKFIIDGVQAELNFIPNTCRGSVYGNIASSFRGFQEMLKKQGNGLTADFSRTVLITKENLMDLDEKSRVLGCAPSMNIYGTPPAMDIANIDGTKYLVRSAGGHIHIGNPFAGYFGDMERHIELAQRQTRDAWQNALVTQHQDTVALLDIICGNTMVLIDRDEGNIERRKVYGRAGEYRTPKHDMTHGLEYRVLSNFWLTANPLMSLAFGMARLAVQLAADPINSKLFIDAFTSAVDMRDVQTAINNNDYDIALHNFEKIAPMLLEVTDGNHEWGNYPVTKSNIKQFDHFVATVKEKGLQHYFPENPVDVWANRPLHHSDGFFNYSRSTIADEMKKAA